MSKIPQWISVVPPQSTYFQSLKLNDKVILCQDQYRTIGVVAGVNPKEIKCICEADIAKKNPSIIVFQRRDNGQSVNCDWDLLDNPTQADFDIFRAKQLRGEIEDLIERYLPELKVSELEQILKVFQGRAR